LIGNLDIFPNYYQGFTFNWDVDPSFRVERPWTFVIQESTNEKDWVDISPELQDVVMYQEDRRRLYGKENNITYRIKSTAQGKVYYSHSIAPYTKLSKREYLLAREIMRKESLMLDKMSGVSIELWRLDPFKRALPKSVDPISGIVISPDLNVDTIYYGPYKTKASFTPTKVDQKQDPNGSGIIDIRNYQVRILGFPPICDDDILVDTTQDRRYYVKSVSNVAEIRRFPVVQTLIVSEAPKGDPAYKL